MEVCGLQDVASWEMDDKQTRQKQSSNVAKVTFVLNGVVIVNRENVI